MFVLSTTKSRKQRLVKSFGSAHPNDTAAMEKLMQRASSFIQEMEGPSLPHIYEEEDVIDVFVSSLSNTQLQVAGPELVFGTLYDRIGYGVIPNRMFRNIVICRLFNPGSKLKTADYKERYLHVTYSVDQIYRFLDNLCYRKEEDMKGCDALLRLQRNTEPRLFELACENAIRFERYSYKFIDSAVKSKCLGILEACCSDEMDAPPEHENIRGVFY